MGMHVFGNLEWDQVVHLAIQATYNFMPNEHSSQILSYI